MKLVPLRQAQVRYMNFMRQSQKDTLRLLTFKKDRSLTIKKEAGKWLLEESGFVHETILLDNHARKQLKQAFAREFPRSSRLYMQED